MPAGNFRRAENAAADCKKYRRTAANLFIRGAPPPILLIHGDQDPMIPFDAMFMAAEALAGASIPTQWHLSLGIGHGIDAEGLRQGGLFLAKAFADRRR